MLCTLAIAGAIGYAAMAALLYLFQEKLVYLPDAGRNVGPTPLAAGLAFDEVRIETGDGVKLHGWFVPRAEPKGAALVFHGNAGSLGMRVDWLRMFHDLGYASLIVSYRGYGMSEGAPSELGTYRDAEAAWSYLTNGRRFEPGSIVIVGESLGGAVAGWLASRVPARALVLQSTFTSLPDLAAGIYPVFPVRWLARIDYGTRGRLAAVRCPVLIAHSREDEVVPFRHGQALFEAAKEPKRFVEMRGGHNEAFIFAHPEWRASLASFLEEAERARR